jgi:medium-chain acyl-[acyl-carrier-protein] hydrolase
MGFGIIEKKEYEINYYDVDYKRRILLSTLMNYLSDIAVQQSENLGIGIDYLLENNNAWVLYKISIKINKYPMYKEKVVVKTTPFSFKKFYAYRKFEVLNADGELVVEANSQWVFINTERRRPARITEKMYEAYEIRNDSDEVLTIENIPELQRVDNQKEFNVRYNDIDTNKHVNNVKYAIWEIETVPVEVVLNYTLSDVNIFYKKETTYGEMIKSLAQVNYQEDKVECIHKIVDSKGTVLNVAKTIWNKNL